MVKNTKVIALISGLLLFAGQLSSVLHATDHLFHAPSEICLTFVSMEQHDFAVPYSVLAVERHQSPCKFNSSSEMLVLNTFINANNARAPPLLV